MGPSAAVRSYELCFKMTVMPFSILENTPVEIHATRVLLKAEQELRRCQQSIDRIPSRNLYLSSGRRTVYKGSTYADIRVSIYFKLDIEW